MATATLTRPSPTQSARETRALHLAYPEDSKVRAVQVLRRVAAEHKGVRDGQPVFLLSGLDTEGTGLDDSTRAPISKTMRRALPVGDAV